ncbi:hypothetical protein BROUX41_002772 [Berkeleyomyces rouxiae]|uniref:uncharacterized protein n=1 Tax=Berkeleyomyces rouxiae TaxID=2035830 RepID=UPI003B7C4C66
MRTTRAPLDQYRNASNLEDWVGDNNTNNPTPGCYESNIEQQYRQRPRNIEAWRAGIIPTPQAHRMAPGSTNMSSTNSMNYGGIPGSRAAAPPPITTTNLNLSPTSQHDDPISSASPWGVFTLNNRRQYVGSEENLRSASCYNSTTSPAPVNSPLAQMKTYNDRSSSPETKENDYTTGMANTQRSIRERNVDATDRASAMAATRGREILSSMFSSRPSSSSLSSAASRDRGSQPKSGDQTQDRTDLNNSKTEMDADTNMPSFRNPEHRNTIPSMAQTQQTRSATLPKTTAGAPPSRSSMPQEMPSSILTSSYSSSSTGGVSTFRPSSAAAYVLPQTRRGGSRPPMIRSHTSTEYAANPVVSRKTSFPTIMPSVSGAHLSGTISMPGPVSMPGAMSGPGPITMPGPMIMPAFANPNAPMMSPLTVSTPSTPGMPISPPIGTLLDPAGSQGPAMWLASADHQTPGAIGLVPLNTTSMTMCTGSGPRDYFSRPESTIIPLQPACPQMKVGGGQFFEFPSRDKRPTGRCFLV